MNRAGGGRKPSRLILAITQPVVSLTVIIAIAATTCRENTSSCQTRHAETVVVGRRVPKFANYLSVEWGFSRNAPESVRNTPPCPVQS